MEEKTNNSEKRKKIIKIFIGVFLFIVIILVILLPDNIDIWIYYKITGGKIVERVVSYYPTATEVQMNASKTCLSQVPNHILENCIFIRVDLKKSQEETKNCNSRMLSSACNLFVCEFGCPYDFFE